MTKALLVDAAVELIQGDRFYMTNFSYKTYGVL